MSARDLPPGPSTQRSAEHHEKLHWPVNGRLSQAHVSTRGLGVLGRVGGKLLKVKGKKI
jgi:hypothetical protein